MKTTTNNLVKGRIDAIVDPTDHPLVSFLKRQSAMMLLCFKVESSYVLFGADAVEGAFCLNQPLWFRPGKIQIKSECLTIRQECIEDSVERLVSRGNPVGLIDTGANAYRLFWPVKLEAPEEQSHRPEPSAVLPAVVPMVDVIPDKAVQVMVGEGWKIESLGSFSALEQETGEIEVPF